MRRLLPLAVFAAFATALVPLAGCANVFTPVRDRAIDACRVKAQDDGWRVQGVENVRREGTAQRVEMRATRLVVLNRTLVCYYDPARGTATLN